MRQRGAYTFSAIASPRRFAYSQSMAVLTPDEIVRLSPSERMDLIAQLWDSLDDRQLPLPEAQQTELELRLASLDRDRSQGITWAALKADLERRCP